VPACSGDRSAYFPAIEAKYGKPMKYWFTRMKVVSDRKYPEQVAFLRDNFGFTREHANALVLYVRGSTTSKRYETLDDYLDQFDPAQSKTARAILKAITSKYRQAEIVMAWNQPMVKLDKQYIFGLSIFKSHILMSPWSVDVIDEIRPRLDGLQINKKTIRVPIDWPVDVELLRDMAAARIAEAEAQG
jgi:uncharacterized protein YdhG (YjbR/CyaY superfamily)